MTNKKLIPEDMTWYDIEVKCPKIGDEIIAKLKGCKIAEYISMTVRDGEGLGYIDKWCYVLKKKIFLK